MTARLDGGAAALLVALVQTYRRLVSPLLPPRCRFAPTCSAYAVGALQTHGARRGSWLAARRVVSCHPFHPGGYDPVPPARSPGGDAGPGSSPTDPVRSPRTAGGPAPYPPLRPGATRA